MKSVIGAATAAALAAVSLAGCGTITQGTSQDIAITSSPPGGHCDLNRKGEHVASLYRTPGSVIVDKSVSDIVLTCDKPGYQTASVNLESDYSMGLFGNVIIGGAIGVGVDYATGAANKYPSTANVQFVPLEPAAATVQIASRPLCTPADQELARLAEENHYSVRLICD
jgi:hypothetical protein